MAVAKAESNVGKVGAVHEFGVNLGRRRDGGAGGGGEVRVQLALQMTERALLKLGEQHGEGTGGAQMDGTRMADGDEQAEELNR